MRFKTTHPKGYCTPKRGLKKWSIVVLGRTSEAGPLVDDFKRPFHSTFVSSGRGFRNKAFQHGIFRNVSLSLRNRRYAFGLGTTA
jgi:hypothetical protein